MIQRVGEAIVLRVWPFHEADLLVSLFTREQGRVKGVARHAMRSRRRFGGALEPMTHVRASYAERPKQELVRRSVPYITVLGTRGGSAIAAAALNALIRMTSGR